MSASRSRRSIRPPRGRAVRALFLAQACLGCLLALLITASQARAQAAASPASSATNATAGSAPASQESAAPAANADTKTTAEITTRQENDTTFKVSVNLVVVRVIVRDSKGFAVGTLKKEDFQLFDNGKPQTIARFAVEQSANALPPGGTRGKDGTSAKAQAPERYVAYLFDDVHLQASDVIQTRNAALNHLNTLLPTDRAAVYTTSGQTMLDFTDDRAKLRDTLGAIRPTPIATYATMNDCPDISFYQADLIINKHDSKAYQTAVQDAVDCMHLIKGDPSSGATSAAAIGAAQPIVMSAAEQKLTAGTEQTRMALGTLRDVVNRTAMMPGQRTVVLVSPGFLLVDLTQRETEVIDRALRSNVIISTLDARGLYTLDTVGDITKSRTPIGMTGVYVGQLAAQSASEEANVLSELAYGTGGTYFHNNNDLKEGFRRVTEAPEFYYVLGFAPQNLKNDGKYHSLKVKLKEKQPYTLQARKGYYAPKRAETLAERAKSDINDAVFSQEERKDMPVELQTKFFKTSDEAAKLAVLVKVDVRHLRYQKVDGRNRNDLTIVSALFDRNGNFVQGDQKTLEMRLTDETLQKKLNSGVTLRANFDVKPGSYLLRCVVRDDDGQLSATNDAIEIP